MATQYTMSSDVRSSRHRQLEQAFKAASRARNKGAQEICIEANHYPGELYQRFSYRLTKMQDGMYARVAGSLTDRAWIAENRHGTEWKNQHPIVTLYLLKLVELNGCGSTLHSSYELAEAACRVLAGEES